VRERGPKAGFSKKGSHAETPLKVTEEIIREGGGMERRGQKKFEKEWRADDQTALPLRKHLLSLKQIKRSGSVQ